jgi:beta-phosphoglucomutase-like phosphatase (HAD superfamily)
MPALLPAVPRAAIFDFNGTISLDEPVLDRLFRDAFAEIGILFDSAFYYRELAGLSDPEIVERALVLHGRPAAPDLCAALLRAKIDRYKEVVAAEPTITPVIVAFLRETAGRVPVAIGSGAVREEIAFQLELHGLTDLFGILVTIDDVVAGKPDPETYARCLELLRVDHPDLAAGDCVVFEDSRHGVAAAHALGMRCVGIHSSGERSALASADAIVDGLGPELVEPLFGG